MPSPWNTFQVIDQKAVKKMADFNNLRLAQAPAEDIGPSRLQKLFQNLPGAGSEA